MKKTFRNIFVVLIASSILSCKKEPSTTPTTIPSVSSTAVSSITGTTAISGGNIIDDGGATIVARGICYSKTVNPTLSNNVVTSGSGTGGFTCSLTGLTPNTTYYLRAYATNSVGTAYGNNEIIFNTLLSQPTLTTFPATSITGNVAAVEGKITNDGGSIIITRGVCYGMNANPTIADSIALSLTGLDSFTVNLTGLIGSTTYYARAYATTSAGTGYGNQINFTTSVQLIALGQNYNGGIIFYLDDSKLHGLISAPNDQSTSANWGCSGIAISGADGIAVGSGAQNTIDILNGCTSSGNAATICSNLILGGYSDWVLPSEGELDLMNQNLYLLGLGNFSTFSYWSSTEVDFGNASSFNFSTHTQSNANKNSPYAVRAIRGF